MNEKEPSTKHISFDHNCMLHVHYILLYHIKYLYIYIYVWYVYVYINVYCFTYFFVKQLLHIFAMSHFFIVPGASSKASKLELWTCISVLRDLKSCQVNVLSKKTETMTLNTREVDQKFQIYWVIFPFLLVSILGSNKLGLWETKHPLEPVAVFWRAGRCTVGAFPVRFQTNGIRG